MGGGTGLDTVGNAGALFIGGKGGAEGVAVGCPFVFRGKPGAVGGGVSRAGGGGGTAVLAGGGGACAKGGGTGNLEGASSSIGVLGGLGGGGGPGFARLFEAARALEGRLGGAWWASFPASAIGGGTLNRGGGGAGGGEGERWRTMAGAEAAVIASGLPPRRGGGGAGGAPLLDEIEEVLPVC